MTWWQAALWGLTGGGAASLLSLSASVVAGGYKWPWRNDKGDLAPRLFVLGCGLALGAVVAAAAHDQMNGPWPAFIFGISAPATIRGILSGVEVEPKPRPKATTRRKPPSIEQQSPETGSGEGPVREDAR
ncbi:hypothetical protein [Streptomyces sp. NBC_00827]|uniref:hypothetical protein n=1 Tax=Streptomyces sp. NBC_00827 TaxID=2903677 RepID=UPI00386FF2E9|nr:hypothetical protein OG569_42090 [Streptomyces sp. NBC_00827]